MRLFGYFSLVSLFGHLTLGDYLTFDSLCPEQDTETVTLNGGEYTVTCGGYFSWAANGDRVDLGTASPEACVDLCSQSADCDAMVFDEDAGGACWEYSAQFQTLNPEVDPHGRTVLLSPVVKRDPSSGDGGSTSPPEPPPPPIKTPEEYELELEECEKAKQLLKTGKETCDTDREKFKGERDTCNTQRDKFRDERDTCNTQRDKFRDERDTCNTKKDKVTGERDDCLKKLPKPVVRKGPNNLVEDDYQCNEHNFGKIVKQGGRSYEIIANTGKAPAVRGKTTDWVSARGSCNIDCCIQICNVKSAKFYTGHATTGAFFDCFGAVVDKNGMCSLEVLYTKLPPSTQPRANNCYLRRLS